MNWLRRLFCRHRWHNSLIPGITYPSPLILQNCVKCKHRRIAFG